MTISRSDIRPSQQHARLIAGKLSWDECHTSVQSWARLEIFKRAQVIARLSTSERRHDAIARQPETIREQVKAEAIRLFKEQPK